MLDLIFDAIFGIIFLSPFVLFVFALAKVALYLFKDND
jgi:hypothetical protein